MTVKVHGWAFSPYVRAVRIALNEKGVAHEHVPLTPPDLATPEGRSLTPFGRVPVLEHDGLRLFETAAILDYVEAALDGPALKSGDAWRDALSAAIIAAAGHYLYPTAVMGVFFQQAYVLANGGQVDAAALQAAAEATRSPLAAIEASVGELLAASGGPFLGGAEFGLADASLAPIIQNLSLAEEGRRLLVDRPLLSAWFGKAVERPSLKATEVPIPKFGLPRVRDMKWPPPRSRRGPSSEGLAGS
jgi:glutathione S-transferase